MQTFPSIQPLAAVLVSALAALLVLVLGSRPNLREALTLIAAAAKFALVLGMLPAVLDGRQPEISLFQVAPGIALALRVDAVGILFGLSASLLWILTSFYAIGYMRGLAEKKQTRFFASLALCLSATIGLAFAANLLTFVLFYEILTIATYPLVTHKGTPEAIAGGRKYLVYALSAGVALIPAVASTFAMAGTLDFRPGGILSPQMGSGMLLATFLLFLLGFGVKAGLMPMHGWLPTAMVAPTPVSALLHAVAVVKAGVFGFVRMVGWVFGPETFRAVGGPAILGTMAALTIVLASLIAIRQDNLKLRLAYSTVAHLSYILLGLALLAPSAFLGAVFYLVAHAVMKITLFFCAGAIYVRTHCTKVSELDGIGRRMPVTMAAFTIGALGLAGMPAIAGFVSKWHLAHGAVEADRIVLLVLLSVGGVLSGVYLLPICVRAFFVPAPGSEGHGEASRLLVVPLALTALLALVLGLAPDAIFHFLQLTQDAARDMLAGGAP